MAAKDAIDVWKETRDYVLSRMKNRYNTIDEAKEEMNTLFEYAMQVQQENYDRFFEKEIFEHLDTYNIEILGDTDKIIEEDEIVEEDAMVDELPEDQNDMFADEEVSDEEINESFKDELK